MSIKYVFILAGVCLVLGSCQRRTDDIPAICSLPEGVTVASIVIEGDDNVDLPATGETGFSVTVNLSRALRGDETAAVCYVLRDSEVVRGQPLAASNVGFLALQEQSVTRANSFRLTCENGRVAGRGPLSEFDRNSGERSTRVFAQHLESFRVLGGTTVGIRGVTSNRIRATCPR